MRALLLPLVCASLAVCSSGTTQPSPPGPLMPSPPLSSRQQPGPPPAPVADADAHAIGAASNLFAADLWARLRDRRGNLAVSPASAWLALAMTQAGARNATDAEMIRVLHLPAEAGPMRTAAGNLLAAWNDPARTSYTLRVVNRLFGEKTYRFEQPFLDLTRDVFRAPFEPVDFVGAADASRGHINAWVAEQTERRIRDLLPPGSLDDTTRLVLTNAVYFLAKWLVPFQRQATHDAPFTTASGSAANVPTMHQTANFRFAQPDGLQVLEMRYRGEELAMDFFLPRDRAGLPALEASLSAAALDGWVAALAGTRVMVSLPKFTIDPAGSLSLSDVLRQMGMASAFDPSTADFTGMAVPPDPRRRLYISNVFHKAFVKVDEEGTEAAAATAVVMVEGAGMPPPESPPEFKADHPFLFFLRDLRSGAILFAGRVEDPRGP